MCVYGATAAGVMAALAAARAGADVALVEAGRHVGGMVASGLSWTDFGDHDAVSGLVREFYATVARYYDVTIFGVKGPEPHVAEKIFADLLADARVRVELGCPLVSVEIAAGEISGIKGPTRRFQAGVFVDASYEGDLMAQAGVSFRVGREPRSLHGEHWAGRQPAYRPGAHNFAAIVSPFAGTPGPSPGTRAPAPLLPEIVAPGLDERGWPEEALGEGDGALQAYQLRLCMTDRPGAGLPLAEPAGFDPARFEVLARYLAVAGERLGASQLLGLVPDLLPGGKCDVNSIGPFSLNVLDGSNRTWPGAGSAAREAIYEHHRRYAHELLYFLTTGAAVPAHIRQELAWWSLAADEFTDNAGWPHQLYVREARRMVGRHVLTEQELLHPGSDASAVATGSYNIDIREIERTWRYLPEYVPQAGVFNEGYLSVPVPPYSVPYGCLLPRREEAANLLVPVCCSASHVAYGSLRTEPTLMALGEAAGTAAALASRSGAPPGDIDPAAIRQVLGRRQNLG